MHGVGSMYDTVEIKSVRKKCMPFWLFCGLNDKVVSLFTAVLEEDQLLQEEATFTLDVSSKRCKK